MLRPSFLKSAGLSLAATFLFAAAPFAGAQSADTAAVVKTVPGVGAQPLITQKVDLAKLSPVGRVSNEIAKSKDLGVAPADMKMDMQLVLRRSDAQTQALNLLRKQTLQPNNAIYGKTVTAEEFASTFGLAKADLAILKGTLEAAGFTVGNVDNGRLAIDFSGTASLVATVFHTDIHQFEGADGAKHFANIGQLQIPKALAPAVSRITGVDNFSVVTRKGFDAPVTDFIPGTTGEPTPLASAPKTVPEVKLEGEGLHDASFTASKYTMHFGDTSQLNVRIGGSSFPATGSLALSDQTGKIVAFIPDITVCEPYNGGLGRSCNGAFKPTVASTYFLKATYSGDEHTRGTAMTIIANVTGTLVSDVGAEFANTTNTTSPLNVYTGFTGGKVTAVVTYVGTTPPTSTDTVTVTFDTDGVVFGTATPLSACTANAAAFTYTCTITDANAYSDGVTSDTAGYSLLDVNFSGDANYAASVVGTQEYIQARAASVTPTVTVTASGTSTYGTAPSFTTTVSISATGGKVACGSAGFPSYLIYRALTGTGAVATPILADDLDTNLAGDCSGTTTSSVSGTVTTTYSAFVPPGTYALNAPFTGNTAVAVATYIVAGAVSTGTNTLTVAKGPATLGTATATPASVAAGSSTAVALSDTITFPGVDPTGAVTFAVTNSGGTAITGSPFTAACANTAPNGSSPITCTATIPAATVAALANGTYTVAVSFAGDNFYVASTGTSTTFLVKASSSSTLAAAVPASVVYGSGVTVQLSDAITVPTATSTADTVTFTINAGVTAITSEALSACGTPTSGTGTKTYTCTYTWTPPVTTTGDNVGSYTITATFNGDSGVAASTSTTPFAITQHTTTTGLVVTTAPTQAAPGAVLTSTTSYAASTGLNSSGTVTLSGGGLTSVVATLPVEGSSTTTTGTFVTNGGGSYSCAVSTANKTVTCTFTFTSVYGTLTPGTDTITSTYSGDVNYSGSNGSATVSVPDTIVLTASPTTEVYGSGGSTTITDTITVPNGSPVPTGTITITATDSVAPPTGAQAVTTITVNATNCPATTGATTTAYACSYVFTPPATATGYTAGTLTLSAAYSGGNYTAATTTTTYTITKDPTTTTVSANPASVSANSTNTTFSTVTTWNAPGLGINPAAADTVVLTCAPATGTTGTCSYTATIAISSCTITPAPTRTIACTFPNVNFDNDTSAYGGYVVTATFSGDTDYGTSAGTVGVSDSSGSGTATTTTVTTVSGSPVTYGSGTSVVFSAVVTGVTGKGAPTGTLTLSSPGLGTLATVSTATCTATNTFTYTCSVTYPVPVGTAVGTYSVTANYSGNATYLSSSSTTPAQFSVVGATPTTATISAVSVPYGSTTGVTVTATEAGSAGPVTGGVVTFSVVAPATGSFSPTTCTLTAAGTCTTTFIPTGTLAVTGSPYSSIKASFAAVGNYAAATATNTETITADTTTVTVTPNPTAIGPGGTSVVTLTVNNSSSSAVPPGFFTLTDTTNNVNLGQCTLSAATCTISVPGSSLQTGTNVLTAVYTSTTTNIQGSTGTGTLTLNGATATTTTLTATTSAGTTTAGVTSVNLLATVTPTTDGTFTGGYVMFIDATNNVQIGGQVAITSGGTATLTVNTSTAGVSAGLNNITATFTGNTNYLASPASSPVPIYLQGILQATSLNHNFTVFTTGETGVDGTTDGSPICNGSNGINGQTCTTGYSVAVTNFTSSSQVITAALGSNPHTAFSYVTNCPAAGLAAGAKCQFVFYYLPPYGDGCTPNSNCTTGGTAPNTYQQGTFEEADWTVGASGVLKGLYFSGTTGGGLPTSPVYLEGKAILASGNYLTVTPTSLSFGPQAPNSVSATQDITVTNTSSAAVSGIAYSVAAGSSTNSHFTTNNQCTASLAAHASCQIQVSYSDTTAESSTLNLTITPPTPEGLLNVSLSGSTVATTETLSLSTTTHNFGNVTVGSTVSFGLGLTNNSADTVSTPSFTYSQANGFTFNTSACPATLAAGATCEVSVSFTPTSAGNYSQILTVRDNLQILPNGTTSAPYSDAVTFNGSGVAGGNLTATSTGHDFGNTTVGSSATSYGVELSNNTGQTVTLSTGGGTFASNGAADGYTYATNCGSTMAANTNCEYVFYYTPQSVGLTQVLFPLSGGASYPLNGNSAITGITLSGTGQ